MEEMQVTSRSELPTGEPARGRRPLAELGVKMRLSNLGPEVTNKHLKDIFGPILKAEIFYKQDGSSSGHGVVVFKRRADADKVHVCVFDECASYCPYFLGGWSYEGVGREPASSCRHIDSRC